MKKIAIVIMLSLGVMSAHAGFMKKVLIAGAATYAGHTIAKKIEAKQEEKKVEQNKVNSVNKEIPR